MHGGTTRRALAAAAYRRAEAECWAELARRMAAAQAARERLAAVECLGWPIAVGPGFGWPGVAQDPQTPTGPVWCWTSPTRAQVAAEARGGPHAWLEQARRAGLRRPEALPPTWLLAAHERS